MVLGKGGRFDAYLFRLNAAGMENRGRRRGSRNCRQLRRLKYITGMEDGSDNIFMFIRRHEKKTQAEMADCTGLDIKKYSNVEQGVRLPDSKLFLKGYALFDIPPAYIIKDKRGLSCEIEYHPDKTGLQADGVICRHFCLLMELYAVSSGRSGERKHKANKVDLANTAGAIP